MNWRATRFIVFKTLESSFSYLDAIAFAMVFGAVLFNWPETALIASGTLGVAAAALAPLQHRRIASISNVRYFAAPLYGRELARAFALGPCITLAVFSGGAIFLYSLVRHRAVSQYGWMVFGTLVSAEVVATLIALSGCFRAGQQRVLYAVLAMIAGIAIWMLGVAGTPLTLVCAVLAAVAIGFAALRALGETLARYDPVDDLTLSAP